MKMKIVPTAILGILGLIYLAVPHDIHVSSGLGFGLDHSVHVVLGIALLALAAVVYWKMK